MPKDEYEYEPDPITSIDSLASKALANVGLREKGPRPPPISRVDPGWQGPWDPTWHLSTEDQLAARAALKEMQAPAPVHEYEVAPPEDLGDEMPAIRIPDSAQTFSRVTPEDVAAVRRVMAQMKAAK